MKKILSLLSICAFAFISKAQTPVSITGTTYNQNFNLLDTTYNVASNNLPSGWSIFEVGTSASVDQKYKPYPAAAANSGDTYSFGTSNTTDRALGSLRSATNRMRFGVGFKNNSGSAITSLNIAFKGEQWRSGDTAIIADSLYLEYSTTATGISDTLASWSPNWSTMFNSPITNLAATILDGNVTANSANVNGMITVSIPVGGTIYLRWVDVNLGGSDDGLAIDDLSITFGSGIVNQPLIVSTIPANNANGVAIGSSSLSVTFDKNLTIGTGNIYVKNLTDATQQTIPVASTSISGMTATIPNVTLLPAKSYAVQFDSTCYKNGTFNGYGIYNNTTWAFQTLNPKPLITSLTPADNSNGVLLTSNAVVTFDKNITVGTGSIRLFNITDNIVTQTITLPSASVVIATNQATISGLSLVTGKSYAMQYDSTCFQAGAYNCIGIYDTTTWNFSTTMPPPPPVTSLNETFIGCAAPLLGAFIQTSVIGNQVWGCSTFGHTDANSVRMNGGNTNADNTDWLISPPIDATANPNVYFSFWSKRRFNGVTTKEVYVTNNFMGDPTTATWTLLPVNLSALDTVWTAFKNINMNAYKATPFNVAFKYVGTLANPSDEWTVDDVSISQWPSSASTIQLANNDFYVVGKANEHSLEINVTSSKATSYQYAVLDMTGKVIATNNFNVLEGKNNKTITLPNMASGMYVLQIWNAEAKGVTKFMK
jgi:trimeric autotransporter adhesin